MAENELISKLKSNNYVSWSVDVKVLLMEKNCWEIVNGKEVEPLPSATPKELKDYKQRKNKAYSTIYLSISSDYRALISDTEDGKTAWEKLEKHFQPDSRARVIGLLDEFFNCRISENEEIGLFAARLKRIVSQMKDAGHPLEDIYQSFQLIRYLPPEFSGIVQSIYRWGDKEFKFDRVVDELLAEESRLKQSQGDKEMICCFICSKPGYLVLCDNVNCSKSYCSRCIEELISPQELSRIFETSPWLCFFCLVTSGEKGLLCIQADWEENLQNLLEPTNLISDEVPMSDYAFKKPINVLSLFDGISTGKLVLDLLGIEIANYFACEIDEDALSVSKLHHGNRIIYVGDVTSITEEKLQSICPIDLIIGGSPCNDLSLVNPCRKGIYDITGTGHLFFDFYHILKMAEKMSNRHIFFLFENVFAMQKSTKQIISNFLQTEPIVVDSKYYTPQCRARYFWGNIPGMNMQQKYRSSFADGSGEEHQSEKLLQSCLMEGVCRKAMVDKIRTVTTQPNSLIQTNRLMPVEMNGTPDTLWVTEVERIFGFPVHYTDTGNLSTKKRRELLGRSWSVPVIKNILYPLTTLFKTHIH